jgi:hypothetical protein
MGARGAVLAHCADGRTKRLVRHAEPEDDSAMRRAFLMAFVLGITGCAPAVAHLGGNTYRLSCEEGMGVCRHNASRACPLGYDVVESSTASTGGGTLLVRCVEPKKAPASVAPERVVLEESTPCPAIPNGLECVRNFQCSAEGARCIDGRCMAATATSWFDGTAAPSDAGSADGASAPDAGTTPAGP